MDKSKLSVLIILAIILSVTFNIQFIPAKVYAQSDNSGADDKSLGTNDNTDRAQTLLERARKHIEQQRLINAQTTLTLLLSTVDSNNVSAQ